MDCFGRTQQAKNKTEEAQAREKLELVLLDLQTDKAVDSAYNENEYIDNKIKENGMIVSGDIVFVDGYQFQLDRSVPKIGVSIGKGEEDSQIEITMTNTTSSDFVKATIHIEITYEQDIATIIFDGENLEIPEKQDGKYVIEKEVYNNGTYSVIVKNSGEKYNIASITITDISEDINIYTADDLVAFRNKVNNGATFEGKTIKVMSNLDLKDVCGADTKSWEPIGNYAKDNTHIFKGTFDGNYHKIDNIYINTTEGYQGLFGYNAGTIENIVIKSGEIKNTGVCTGSIVGNSTGIINNCGNHIDVESNDCRIGGIVGCIENASINGCYNYGNITGKGQASASCTETYTGGIVGAADCLKISNCYNIGKITSIHDFAGGILGCTSVNGGEWKYINNSYNIGMLTASIHKGSITGVANRIYKFE